MGIQASAFGCVSCFINGKQGRTESTEWYVLIQWIAIWNVNIFLGELKAGQDTETSYLIRQQTKTPIN